MKVILSILFLLTFQTTNLSQDSTPFSYLNKIEVKHFEGYELYLKMANNQIINKSRMELDKSHLFYAEECEGEFMTLIAVCSIDSSNRRFAIMYSACPNPEFLICDSNKPDKEYITINAEKLYIPGNGFLYSAGGENTFNVKRKFKLTDDKILEVVQPYYYVGLKTKTLKPIKLYQTQTLKNLIAVLPENYSVEILLSKKPFNSLHGLYLVKTDFGLIGWAQLETNHDKNGDIDKLIYNGD